MLDKREEKSLIVSQVKLVLESPYNNMVDQIKASRRSKWFSLKTLTLFDCVPCTLIEMMASWNTYLFFAGGTSDLSWSIWSGLTSWTWNFGEQFEPDKGNFMWPRVEILEQQILKLLEALEPSGLYISISWNPKVRSLVAKCGMSCFDFACSRRREGKSCEAFIISQYLQS